MSEANTKKGRKAIRNSVLVVVAPLVCSNNNHNNMRWDVSLVLMCPTRCLVHKL